ncbi:MAG: NAD(P)-binding protein [Bryobacteraceae bacterium]
MSTYDGIILGSGHNSLILAAYAARAGLRVLCVERRNAPGGGLTTVENPRLPGFLHNTHSFFHRAITRMPWYTDLDLAARGAVYIEPELNAVLVRPDGETPGMVDLVRPHLRLLRRFLCAHDARQLRLWRDRFVPVLGKILPPESRTPPLPPSAAARCSNKARKAACCSR